MTAISWLGFSPQSVIITVVIILLILGLGLQWEALVASDRRTPFHRA